MSCTGYFTSRPALKFAIQQANNFLQTCKQVAVLANQGKPSESTLQEIFWLAEPVAVNQHHDAITGTAKQHVTDDYQLRLSIGMQSCEKVLDASFR